MQKYFIAPSIIAADFAHLADDIAACEAAGADWIHVDIMDGHFVPQITVGPLFTAACKRSTKLPLDVHLMIENPGEQLPAFAAAGASNITVHVEACADLARVVNQIKAAGCTAGVTLRPATPVSAIEAVLPIVDLVLVMSVNPGFSGQAFMPEMIEKVRDVRARLDRLSSRANLEVDGGITVGTLPLMQAGGADAFVAGNAIFKHPSGTSAGLHALRASLA